MAVGQRVAARDRPDDASGVGQFELNGQELSGLVRWQKRAIDRLEIEGALAERIVLIVAATYAKRAKASPSRLAPGRAVGIDRGILP